MRLGGRILKEGGAREKAKWERGAAVMHVARLAQRALAGSQSLKSSYRGQKKGDQKVYMKAKKRMELTGTDRSDSAGGWPSLSNVHGISNRRGLRRKTR